MEEDNRLSDLFPLKIDYKREDIFEMICKGMESWRSTSPDDLEITRCMGATNISFKVKTLKPQILHPHILLKICGENVYNVTNREKEIEIVGGSSDSNLGPTLLYSTITYRIEKIIEGSPLSIFELNNKLLVQMFAHKICDFHNNPKLNQISKEYDQELLFCNKLIDIWLPQFQNKYTQFRSLIKLEENVKILDMYKFMCEEEFRDECLFLLPKGSKWVSICHNDVSELNILQRDAQRDELYLIDFEYSGLNYSAYDISLYLMEAMFDYKHPDFPYYKLYMNNHMCEEEVDYFIIEYLTQFYIKYYEGEENNISVTQYIEENLSKFKDEVLRLECFAYIFHGIWCFLTIDWEEFNEEKEWRFLYALDKINIYLKLRGRYI